MILQKLNKKYNIPKYQIIDVLMTRDITRMKVFMAALEIMGKDPLDIGLNAPTPGLVNQYFNDSTGENEDGDKDFTRP